MKILIIKLGASGDVVRTLSILPALKEKFPDSNIFWATKKENIELLEGNPNIKEIISLKEIPNKEKFDILYNFDIDEEALKLAETTNACKKYGFYSNEGFPAAFNLGTEYYLNTIFDDSLKKINKKTYQEMIFEVAELDYKRQHCPIFLNEEDKKYGEDFLKNHNLNRKKLIGIHLGASSRWPSKVWHKNNLIEFIIKANKEGLEIIVFGGPDEIEAHQNLKLELENKKAKAFFNNPENTKKQFASLVNVCSKMICSDSFSLHIALALKKPTIGLFFCTPPNEIEDYGLLKKIVSPLLYEFFPEKMNIYDENLVKSISAEEVLNAVKK